MWASWASLVDLISSGFNSSFMEGKGTGQQIFYNILGWFFGFGVVQVVFFFQSTWVPISFLKFMATLEAIFLPKDGDIWCSSPRSSLINALVHGKARHSKTQQFHGWLLGWLVGSMVGVDAVFRWCYPLAAGDCQTLWSPRPNQACGVFWFCRELPVVVVVVDDDDDDDDDDDPIFGVFFLVRDGQGYLRRTNIFPFVWIEGPPTLHLADLRI